MNLHLPGYLAIAFGLTTVATFLAYIVILKKSTFLSDKTKRIVYLLMLLWLAVQGILAGLDIYSSNLQSFPPKLFVLGIWPGILLIIILMATTNGRRFMDSLPLKEITYLNMVRIAVELMLFALFLNKAIPRLMTFEGGNFDIFSGLSAPLIAYLVFSKKPFKRNLLLIWNIICLLLLINVVTKALLSAPLPVQKFAFDQPNVAILVFPFVWLPTFIVPLVLFGHIVSLRRLIGKHELPSA
ncbi:hypothetical protein [Mucilaginibacter celer]|uniref:Uncharacterized protein n=1 Tax=Mucilaginibacter celer TaxID=2305508 RepID=A0A494VTP1_9SPHI|nr:hypothetical protein [Mucilaginibacter celer]AYL94312.1 hypothetical protein HYN43_002940 [Mucilaginibacter celer]